GLPARYGSSLQRNDAGVWLCEYPGLSFQRSPVCACSLVSSLLLSGATMSQQSSLTQSAHSVRQVLTAYTVRDGRHPGGKIYGYRTIAGRRGELEIVEKEAAVVRHIFERYLAGATPRQIAGQLNDDRVLPPRGGDTWRASTINGNTRRANGILQSEIY